MTPTVRVSHSERRERSRRQVLEAATRLLQAGQSYTELDGDTAKVETHVVSYHRVNMGTEERDTCIGGRYLDVMEKRGGEWRIAERTMLYDWYQDWGVSIDWSQGVMGLPLSQEWFSGRANGDHSATFFGKGKK